MALFFIGATVFNILLMAIFVVAFFFLAALLPNETFRTIVVFAGFIAAIVLTFIIYGKAMKWVTVKFQLEKHIPQLYKGKKR
jgi:hypothetical protein